MEPSLQPPGVDAPGPRQPGSLGPARPPLFHVWLLLLTFASIVAAAVLADESSQSKAQLFGRAAAFAGGLCAILLAHEMGHFLAARAHGVDASWPYFIPAPVVGTIGAMVRLREPPRSRRALADIAALGPLCGFFVSLPVLWFGMRLSTVAAAASEAPPGEWTLFDAFHRLFVTGEWPDPGGVTIGLPWLYQLFSAQLFGSVEAGTRLELHPLAVAGWAGTLITSLQLLPLGQLDGGRLLYAASPRLHARLGPPLAAALVALGVFTSFPGWLPWGVVFGTLLSGHLPLAGTPEQAREPLGFRWVLLALCLAALVLSFCPSPFAFLLA
jgi:membrane-associated protease RseP (regulator of RpoE activity)